MLNLSLLQNLKHDLGLILSFVLHLSLLKGYIARERLASQMHPKFTINTLKMHLSDRKVVLFGVYLFKSLIAIIYCCYCLLQSERDEIRAGLTLKICIVQIKSKATNCFWNRFLEFFELIIFVGSVVLHL